MNILDALRDEKLLGTFGDLSTWRPWLAFLAAVYGEPMEDRDLDLFKAHTGLDAPREGGYPEAVVIVGRQSGKTAVAGGVIGPYEAARAVLSGEKNVYIPMVAQDLRGARRALLGYVKQAIQASPLLSKEVTRETSDEIELAGRVTIGVYPCRPAALRGIRSACAVVDELGFFTATDGRPTDTEMLRAIRPSLSTTGGKLIVLSSPHGQLGALWDLYRQHYGKDTTTLVWQATAPEMNPTLPADYLARMEQDDPEAYRSEVLGEFRQGLSTFIDPDALDAVIARDVRERRPEDGHRYFGYVDAASGTGKDSFAVGIAHREGDVAHLDVVRAWSPPFNPSGVISEAADIFKRFGISAVEGDRYAPGFIEEGFRTYGITYTAAPRTTSDTYLETLPLINSGAVQIPDDERLLRELRGLERHAMRSGKDRVDHRRGAHDDRAVAACGALVAASPAGRGPYGHVTSLVLGRKPTSTPPPKPSSKPIYSYGNGGKPSPWVTAR